jgi:hypothetical protein
MRPFSTDKQAYSRYITSRVPIFHAFTASEIGKGARRHQVQKLIADVATTIERLDAQDFGLTVILMKTQR